MFSQKKLFLYFGKRNFPAARLENYTREISELEKLEKLALKKKSFFGKRKFLATSLKKNYIFRRELAKPGKQTKISHVSLQKFSAHFWMTADEAVKQKTKSKKSSLFTIFPAGIYLLKVNNRNNRTRWEICSKLTIKIPERRLASFWYLYC